MANPWLLASLAGLLLAAAAALLWGLGRRIDARKAILHRLDVEVRPLRVPPAEAAGFSVLEFLSQMLQRADMAERPGQLLLLVTLGIASGAAGLASHSVWGLGFALAAYCAVILLYLRWRAAMTRRALVQQLPGFIDHLIRIIGIGRSFDHALLQAIEHGTPLLSQTMRAVVAQHALGGDLADALAQTARVYGIRELHLLTLALRINQRYGGSIRPMLENIVLLIRQRDQADRELRAMTGETRLTAWVMGAIPPLMAGYMMATNPAYFDALQKDPNGPVIIAVAVGLEVAGALLLWRMMWSVR